jgi:flavin reductase (DIM6/NTAB) family NADH-FMN oxidoreductase RutF
MAAVMPAHTGEVAPEAPDTRAFRQAMRCLAGGVCVITACDGQDGGDGLGRTGLTATSVVSLSVDPAELVVSVNQNSSTWPVLLAARRFGVNVLTTDQVDVAQQFAGVGGLRGSQRFAGARWQRTDDGVWLLATGRCAGSICLNGRADVGASQPRAGGRQGRRHPMARPPACEAIGGPLLYWQGAYGALTAAPVEG